MSESTLIDNAGQGSTDTADGQHDGGAPATTSQTGGNAGAVDSGASQGEQKAEDASTLAVGGDTKDGEGKDDNPSGAPEAYEDFKTVDGITLDADLVGDLKALGKELDLPQDKAQKVSDLGVKLMQKMQAGTIEAVAKARIDWANQSKADKEFGGDKLTENLGAVRVAMDGMGTPELKSLLNDTGLGNHPEIIRLLYRVGKRMSEDTPVNGKPNAKSEATPQSLYAASNMNP